MKFRNEDHISAKYIYILIFYKDLNFFKENAHQKYNSISLQQQKIITLGLSATRLRKMPERFPCIEMSF